MQFFVQMKNELLRSILRKKAAVPAPAELAEEPIRWKIEITHNAINWGEVIVSLTILATAVFLTVRSGKPDWMWLLVFVVFNDFHFVKKSQSHSWKSGHPEAKRAEGIPPPTEAIPEAGTQPRAGAENGTVIA